MNRNANLQGVSVCRLTLLILLLSSASISYAKRGGNSGGQPGGGDPPVTAPVSYAVTPVTIPGDDTFFFGHNDDSAVVGSILNSPVGGRRAMAYFPQRASAFYLDDPALGVLGIPAGSHARSALDINNLGAIVGNIERSGAEETLIQPFLIRDAYSSAPVLEVLAPFDPSADKEVAVQVNDSGDIVGYSEKSLGGVTVSSLYVGNPGLHGEQQAEFAEIDFASHGFLNPKIVDTSVQLSNRLASGKAVVSGIVNDQRFRVNTDGTGFDLAPAYTADDGSQLTWLGFGYLNDSGDISGRALAVPSKKGKTKQNTFAAVWPMGSSEIEPVASNNALQSDWRSARMNNDGDYLLSGPSPLGGDFFWHSDWSIANGPVSIANLIDPNDPNGSLFSSGMELTDHGDTADWPTIIARGYEWIDGVEQRYLLILDPVLNTASIAAVPVPEPNTAALALMALALPAFVRRARRNH